MKKLLLTLLLVASIVSCNKAQEQENTTSTQEEEVSNGPTEWIWDGSQFDTLYIGTTLRISNIDGDKVYLVMSK